MFHGEKGLASEDSLTIKTKQLFRISNYFYEKKIKIVKTLPT